MYLVFIDFRIFFESFDRNALLYKLLKRGVKAMPHGSDKSPAKNRNEIRHSLCMLHGSAKSWQIIKKMTHKNLNIVEKTSLTV